MTKRPLRSAVLEKGKALIATPETWTQGSFARDSQGMPVNVTDRGACQFCLLGAVDRAICIEYAMFYGLFADCVGVLASALPAHRVIDDPTDDCVAFNDNGFRLHDEVLALFDRAIAAAKLEEAAVAQ